MEEEVILKQPIDRRIINDLPPGPPGVEMDAASDYDQNVKSASKSGRRRSVSKSPSSRKPKSISRSKRRSPSPRRGRHRESTPDRRSKYGSDSWYRSSKRSRNQSRSRSRDRDRVRSRTRSRSRDRGKYRDRGRRSRSYSPRRMSNDNSNITQWSPKPATSSQAIPPTLLNPPLPAVQPTANAPAPPYNVVPGQMYGENYGTPNVYNQFSMPPPGSQPFVPPPDSYNLQASAAAQFNANYPPPNTWGPAEAYVQQPWMQQHAAVADNPIPQAPHIAVPTPPLLVPPANIHEPEALQNVPVIPQEKKTRNAAVTKEAEHHRGELKKQRVGYQRKMRLLVNELNNIRQKRGNDKSTEGHVDKFQVQIERKIGAIENVIDMLTNIIGDREEFEQIHGHERIGLSNNFNTSVTIQKHESHKDVLERFKKALRATISLSDGEGKSDEDDDNDSDSSASSTSSASSSGSSSTTTTGGHRSKDRNRGKNANYNRNSNNNNNKIDDDDDDSSSERLKTKAIESMRIKKAAMAAAAARAREAEQQREAQAQRFNYTFYDPETHWCRTCNAFPKTARDYLNHLHSTEHIEREIIETPWHETMPNDDFPEYENVETKRVPIRGIMFFSPASSWFCKLCKLWIGDLHCASMHLKSQLHYYKYNDYIAEHPDFEPNWEADRERRRADIVVVPPVFKVPVDNDNTISSSKVVAAPSPHEFSEKSDSSSSSEESSSDSESSDNDNDDSSKAIKLSTAPSTSRAAMTQKKLQEADSTVAPPPPQTSKPKFFNFDDDSSAESGSDERPTVYASKPLAQKAVDEKLLVSQLKEKFKNRTIEAEKQKSASSASTKKRERSRSLERKGHDSRDKRNYRRRSRSRSRSVSRSRNRRGYRSRYSPARGRRSVSRGRRSVSRGRRSVSRGRRSVSRGRAGGWNRRRGPYRRSRSRSVRRRSRTPNSRRRVSRSQTRSRSRSRSKTPTPRIEKPVVKHSEFRPRVPPSDNDKKKTSSESKDKKDAKKLKSSSSTAATNNNNNSQNSNGGPSTSANASGSGNKKLPFIGKMPVFKKQTNSNEQELGTEKDQNEVNPVSNEQLHEQQQHVLPGYPAMPMRPHPPTAAQIQMAMMEDLYGNAPPFHPDGGAGMPMDYDDLMPDPVQYVNMMSNAVPPPPPPSELRRDNSVGAAAEDNDILPPGIDEIENDEFEVVAKPPSECDSDKSHLPRDFEEALNIIFPGERNPEDDDDTQKPTASAGETHIITDDPVMQPEDLVKEGIHMVTTDDINVIAMDEASQMSMNEPLIFKPRSNNTAQATKAPLPPPLQSKEFESGNENDFNTEQMDQVVSTTSVIATPTENADNRETSIMIPVPDEIPMPEEKLDTANADLKEATSTSAMVYDLDDIPRPPASPTESEKNRRQEELDDLAMLGIDADDMAAQCI